MGYDMHFVRKPEGERERVEAARAAWQESVQKRDAYCQANPGAQGKHTHEEFETGDLAEPPANSTDEYKALQREQNRLYELMYLSEPSYFRLNIWGMGACRKIMRSFGMLNLSESSLGGAWPDAPEDGEAFYEWEMAQAEPAKPGEIAKVWPAEQVAEFEAYQKACDAHRRAGPEPAAGMPVWKFGSNDGWIVRPDEIKSALEALDRILQREDGAEQMEIVLVGQGWSLEMWQHWVNYLLQAMDHDGFEVW